MSEHTRTPWSFGPEIIDGNYWAAIRTDYDATIICAMRDGSGDKQDQINNAAFIVTACNSHEAMKEAMKSAMNRLRNQDTASALTQQCNEATYEKCKAALALAEAYPLNFRLECKGREPS